MNNMNLFIVLVLVLKICCFNAILCQTCTKETCEIEEGVIIHWDLNGMDQNDPKLIEAIKTKVLIPPPSKQKLKLRLPTSMKFINGQDGQPSAIERILKSKKLWKKKKQGFFVEAGACAGEQISNTIYFELKHNWTGLLVEPNPDFYQKLFKIKRNAWILPHCLSTGKSVEIVDFDASLFNGGIINPGKVLPSDMGRIAPREYRPKDRKIKVSNQMALQNIFYLGETNNFIY